MLINVFSYRVHLGDHVTTLYFKRWREALSKKKHRLKEMEYVLCIIFTYVLLPLGEGCCHLGGVGVPQSFQAPGSPALVHSNFFGFSVLLGEFLEVFFDWPKIDSF